MNRSPVSLFFFALCECGRGHGRGVRVRAGTGRGSTPTHGDFAASGGAGLQKLSDWGRRLATLRKIDAILRRFAFFDIVISTWSGHIPGGEAGDAELASGRGRRGWQEFSDEQPRPKPQRVETALEAIAVTALVTCDSQLRLRPLRSR